MGYITARVEHSRSLPMRYELRGCVFGRARGPLVVDFETGACGAGAEEEVLELVHACMHTSRVIYVHRVTSSSRV